MPSLEKQNIKTVCLGQTNYPKLLAEINDPPKLLYYRGQLDICNQPTLAVVGSRKYSPYGKQACQLIVGPLAKQGLIIVSGLALGIDGLAHQTTLDSKGKTIAVLGSGIDQNTICPTTHLNLANDILKQGGLLISEYPPGFYPTNYSFPMRNRIIAGLSLGTLIVEAAQKSGALITAQCALDYNRELMAIPHPINSPTGKGVNKLIQSGACLINNPNIIIQTLNLTTLTSVEKRTNILPSNPIETKILEILSQRNQHIDIIIKNSNLDSSTVNGTLTLMELKGMVKNIGGMMYAKIN